VEVVTADVVAEVVIEVEVGVEVVVVVVVAVAVVDADVVFVVLVEHDANIIAATIKQLKTNQINLFFNSILLFI